MKFENYMILEFPSRSCNEAFARSAVACFAAQMDPTLEELGDIRTAVSEAVTNCIVHAYVGRRGEDCHVYISARLYDNREISIRISDNGCGIKEEEKKKIFMPNFTTKSSGMGVGLSIVYDILETLGGNISFESEVGKGSIFSINIKK